MSLRVRIAAIVAVACFALALSGCRKAPKSPEERGAGIFTRTCASCHGPTGRPTRGLGLPVMPRDLSDASFYQQRSDAELEAAIRDGKGAMPAFGTLLSDEDLKLVIAHLHTLAKAK